MKLISIFLALALITTAHAAERPKVYLDTTLVVSAGRVFTVRAGDDLQAIVDKAQPGDTVDVQANATFPPLAIRNKTDSYKWLTIRTSAWASLPAPGVRIGPVHSPLMPKLVPVDTGYALDIYPTSNGFTRARNVRFIGIEIAVNPNFPVNFGLVKIGTNDSWKTMLGMEPTDIIFDRCYVHGLPGLDSKRGFFINSSRTAVIDSYISEFHLRGQESQGILVANAPGPLKIVNCYIEAAGVNVLFGGLDVKITGLIPSDVEFRDNHLSKPLSWNPLHASYSGIHWSVKNLFELKNAQRVWIEGNLFENNWVDAQSGPSILFTPRNQDGGNPWATVKDVNFINNRIVNVAGAISILGTDDINPSQPAERITIKGSIVERLNAPGLGGNGRFLQLLNGPRDVTVQNNSVISADAITPVVFDGAQMTGFVFTDNILSRGQFGVMGSGLGEGTSSLAGYCPGYVFTRNVLIGDPSVASRYPSGNYFVSP